MRRLAAWLKQLERHLVQPLEQRLGVQLVAGLARVVGAQGHAAHACQLLSGNLGILLAVELLPEILVQPAAIHLGLRQRRNGRQTGCCDNRKGKNGTCKTLHVGISLSSAAMELPSLAVCRYGTVPIKFQVSAKKEPGSPAA